MRALLLTLPLLMAPTCDDPNARTAPDPFSDCTTRDGDSFDYAMSSTGTQTSELRIEGDTLFVPVAYGGGCVQHTFVMCWPTQGFSKSLPPQVDLELWHDSGNDTCEAYLHEDVEVDLTPLADAHAKQFGSDDPRVVINIGGESVEYTYQ